MTDPKLCSGNQRDLLLMLGTGLALLLCSTEVLGLIPNGVSIVYYVCCLTLWLMFCAHNILEVKLLLFVAQQSVLWNL